ncbi:MAG: histidine--tRNA ligase [Prosthecochloris sp.]|uniref:Histidine--tRNA ligase n=1 Tax=Prosthecochloris aestuarii (strain DSM 271 / SK 413) TaxID=290512 RepID=SYH_PROA2|nr:MULTISPECIES: histidine--tRNA ligase [Prosthecochloris]B4S4H1.1 RecName: Full=Histidine--tRNA ligase; AltName: Full=Histidyl-tRNA synthetase; Short=HisRS [Prosthecochloris aestuarii DSM 271]ACF45419.1 histidyl-tRNA synthetase [Prosthecochloris aestuarii DSM 271]MCW8798422.1 histidine--tRNA ligase [Prosthecochloris sp.]NEX12383.1 histidine--tRNA ligase [Prosthecochloris sp.]RDD31388.1 histidine--tRNA ligase [Prosthecochloris sp. ZM]
MSHYRAVKGTRDIFPDEVAAWQYVESVIHRVASFYAFHEIRTPVFEYTDLFQRSIGATTDIVGKEMFTFQPDPNGRSITLRPEMTAGVMRAFLQGNRASESPVHKLYYISNLFRKERPQAGRQRQFCQFGAELLGASSPAAVAEVIAMMMHVFRLLGLKGLKLRINTLGSIEDRKRYRDALREYLLPFSGELDAASLERLEKNPLRILDSKNPAVQSIVSGAPSLRDYLQPAAVEEFEEVLGYLDDRGIEYVQDPLLVRGLDYYCHTAFEVQCSDLGAQDALGGGGRYDGLARELGAGADLPAVGFAVGMERLMIALERQGLLSTIPPKGPDVYVVLQDRAFLVHAVALCGALRDAAISTEIDLAGRSMKAQMREANRIKAAYALFVGPDEVASGVYGLKNLESSSQESRSLEAVIAELGHG